MPVRRTLVSLATITALSLTVSGCSVLERLGIGGTSDADIEVVDPTEEIDPTEPLTEEPEETNGSGGLSVPTCETVYSPEQTATLLGEVRVSIGDTSEGDFGYGTTNRDLVAIVKNIRRDLRVSCTWYLPASESVSVTSVAIINSDLQSDITRTLGAAGATSEDLGEGMLWTIDAANSDESPDYVATEAHFLAPVPCPSSLADAGCAVWISSNYVFGNARNLTIDAATQLGVLKP